ncbi:WD repeat domain-containing protein 83 [Neolecta irregularis DAH-3]|uniref:WD repeat domain-containing protein 83 n=1 Tax=Neolecta irregularis (strain DAH-3) TaxID=1198029 RepID=A0A1U7LGK5_NEOID|nr:WD repeat domain-containing protein 83 [Neolecta irregularis DAH-3]|eukprot:OLL21790.1 WD repeat domain-containing protein 83 [Neolecta irregularis DAH-3]
MQFANHIFIYSLIVLLNVCELISNRLAKQLANPTLSITSLLAASNRYSKDVGMFGRDVDYMSLPTQPHRILTKNPGTLIHVVKYNTSGQYCLSGGSDRTITLWNPSTGSKIKTYSAHGWEILDIIVAKDNSKFASCGGDKTVPYPVFLWDVLSGSTLRRFTGHFSRVNAVDLNEEASVVISGSFDATVKLWDCKSQSRVPIQTIDDAKDSITSLQVVGHELVTGSVDGKLRTYDLRMGQLTTDFIGQPITCLKQSSDSKTLLIATLNSQLRLFDKSTGGLLQTFLGHTNTTYRVRSCFAGIDEGYIISGSEDGQIFIWDYLDASIIHQIKAHDGKIIACVDFHAERNQMLSCATDGSVIVWEAN